LSLAQIRRQDRRGEALSLLLGPAIPDSRLLDLKWAQGGLNLTLRKVSIANDLLVSILVHEMLSLADEGVDLCPDGLCQHLSSALAENLFEGIGW
jgi:hypothetical protein